MVSLNAGESCLWLARGFPHLYVLTSCHPLLFSLLLCDVL
jgi:hypothetical protein